MEEKTKSLKEKLRAAVERMDAIATDPDNLNTPQSLLEYIKSVEASKSLAIGAQVNTGVILADGYFLAYKAYVDLREQNREYQALPDGFKEDNEEVGLMRLKDWCIEAMKCDTPASSADGDKKITQNQTNNGSPAKSLIQAIEAFIEKYKRIEDIIFSYFSQKDYGKIVSIASIGIENVELLHNEYAEIVNAFEGSRLYLYQNCHLDIDFISYHIKVALDCAREIEYDFAVIGEWSVRCLTADTDNSKNRLLCYKDCGGDTVVKHFSDLTVDDLYFFVQPERRDSRHKQAALLYKTIDDLGLRTLAGLSEQVESQSTETDGAEKKTGFKFSKGQVHYNGKEIAVSMGRQYEILKKLAEKTGEVISYSELDSQSAASASEQLRTDISEIKKSLKKAKIPFTINSKRTEGYILTSK